MTDTNASIMFFHAPWCGNCKALEPIVKEVASELNCPIIDIDASNNLPLCEQHSVMNLPVLILRKDNKTVRIDGITTKQNILDKLKQI